MIESPKDAILTISPSPKQKRKGLKKLDSQISSSHSLYDEKVMA
jgi:hypothetical protein